MDLLVALFSLAALIWLVPVLQSGRLIAVPMLVLIVGTVLGPAFFAIDGPIQISLDRVLWIAMFGLAAISWRLGELSVPKPNRIDWLVILIVGWFFLSSLRGGPVPTGSSPVARWFFYIVMPAGMYFIARLVEVRRQDIRWLLVGSILLGLYLALTAMMEVSGLHGFVFPRYIVNADVWEFYGRGRGPIMNPSGNGLLMSISLVAATIGFIYTDRRGKLIYIVIGTILLGGVYATLTRSAWMGAVAAVALVAMIYSPRWVRVLGLMAVIVLGGACMAGFKDQLIQMKRDKNLAAADAAKSMELRPLLAVVAWEMFKVHPIIGHGYGHYFEHNDPYHSVRSYELPLEQARSYAQHNVFLSILVDTGSIGCLMFTAWLMMLAGIGWRLVREATQKCEARCLGLMLMGGMTAYFWNGMFQDVMIIPMVHMVLFFLAGLAVTVHQKGVRVVVVPERVPRRPIEYLASV